MVASTRFRCSAAAEETWGRLRSVYKFVRELGLVKDRAPDCCGHHESKGKRQGCCGKEAEWGRGDAQKQGVDWGERALGIAPHRGEQDLGTEARTLHWDCQSRLMLLEARGPSQQAGVALARRRLNGQRTTDVRERFGLDYETASELQEKTKEWLYWACDDTDSEEPELDWGNSGW